MSASSRDGAGQRKRLLYAAISWHFGSSRHVDRRILKVDGALMKPASKPVAVEARCVRLNAKAEDTASLAPVVERRALSRAANEVLIEVRAAAVNPSDVKAATGLMPYAVFPRTSG